ncbi:hypothetical protein Z043_109680 [Scleropages formosus]|uniref:Transforming acidic coiled-coil-containing protein C-terminal domain-containing protein n=1 Tax=Scleropages formosus TaxID=113540 RepID=A0A0P7UBF1_SCLFO|nr:hypothetical protein Z043_109680 [Scleropages formosus]
MAGMSSPVNDENCGVLPLGKHSSSEATGDIFSCAQPTGRPSILRQSQVDNLLPKIAPKGVKVCFQTPRRDPLTNRIVSPTKSLGMAVPPGLNDCADVSHNVFKEAVSMEAAEQEADANLGVGCTIVPVEDVPIQSKGSYSWDFDNHEAVNPFKGSNLLGFSPSNTGPSEKAQLVIPCDVDETPEAIGGQTLEAAADVAGLLDDTLPFVPVDGSVSDLSTGRCSSDSTLIINIKHLSETTLEMDGAAEQECNATNNDTQTDSPLLHAELHNLSAPLREALDFMSHDSFNPLQAGESKLENPAVDVNESRGSQPEQKSPVQPAVELSSDTAMEVIPPSADTGDEGGHVESISLVQEVPPLLQEDDALTTVQPPVAEEPPTMPETINPEPTFLPDLSPDPGAGPRQTDCFQGVVAEAEEEFVPGTTSFSSRLEMRGSEAGKEMCAEKSNMFSSVEDFLAPAVDPLIPYPLIAPDSLVPHLPQPGSAEDAIIEVLRYSQKDMDTALAKAHKENEETLKKCAQDYLSRIRKEEQRYQTLKAHAEEKIALANGEIAQMRTKQKAEMSALQAQLRREQLKVQSLEKSLEQKVKETEELTKLCDDLIVNVQKR